MLGELLLYTLEPGWQPWLTTVAQPGHSGVWLLEGHMQPSQSLVRQHCVQEAVQTKVLQGSALAHAEVLQLGTQQHEAADTCPAQGWHLQTSSTPVKSASCELHAVDKWAIILRKVVILWKLDTELST